MNIKKYFTLLFVLAFCLISCKKGNNHSINTAWEWTGSYDTVGRNHMDSLLLELDKTVESEKKYTFQKEKNIERIKGQLNIEGLTDEDIYSIYSQLSLEYEAYICDSALKYDNLRLLCAEKCRNESWITDSKIHLSGLFAQAALFSTSIEMLNNLNRENMTIQQLATYYKAYANTYTYWEEFFSTEEIKDNLSRYLDSVLLAVPRNSYEYALNQGTKYIELKEYDKAEEIMLSYLPYVQKETRNYAIFTSILTELYKETEKPEKRKRFLAESAICDIKVSIKENLSLRRLAIMLYEEGDLKRANIYIKKSMDDANFYNARLRLIQISYVFPIINDAFHLEQAKQQKKLTLLFIAASVLSFILFFTIALVLNQMRKISKAREEIILKNDKLNTLIKDLSEANEKQKQTNVSLTDANHIKEQFIHNFLELCMVYIKKLDSFKLMAKRKIIAGQPQDLLRILSSEEDSTNELKELYGNFDKAFLAIYPDFIKEFNALLREEERYAEKEALNQELRIFALIRLGITDSEKIAAFLHYSLRTIYNYRSKVRSKAIKTDEDFEERVKRIGRINIGPE